MYRIIKYVCAFCSLLLFLDVFFDSEVLVYMVSIEDVAIITQSGKIVGEPKSSGIHYKIPFFQKVNTVKVENIRTWKSTYKGPIIYNNNELARNLNIAWKVKDPILYFKMKESELNINKEVDSIIAHNFYILNLQGRDYNFDDKEEKKSKLQRYVLKQIQNDLQAKLDKYGIYIIVVNETTTS